MTAPRSFTVTLLGDSISAGYGLTTSQALPAVLERELADAVRPVRVIGAGVSGDATADALRRMDRDVPPETDVCVVALGANDLMQRVAPDRLRDRLEDIIGRLQAKEIDVLLCGMRAPPWFGLYAVTFDAVFPAVARDRDVALYPFLLDGVALNPRLNLPDRIHPNADGIAIIAGRLAPWVRRALEARERR